MKGVYRLRSLSALLVVALVLLTPWSIEARPAAAPRAETAGSIHLFFDWLAGLLVDAGCTFDPSGACRDAAGSGPATDSDSLDNGCSFDPSGEGCGRPADADAGCTFDPNGLSCRDHQ